MNFLIPKYLILRNVLLERLPEFRPGGYPGGRDRCDVGATVAARGGDVQEKVADLPRANDLDGAGPGVLKNLRSRKGRDSPFGRVVGA